MKTFAKSKKKKPFDWGKFLNKEKYSKDEIVKAVRQSESWVTCACGNQCWIIERDEEGVPLDHKLENLGSEFTTLIHILRRDNDEVLFHQKQAIQILAKIEKRSKELILKEVSKAKKIMQEFKNFK